MNLKVVNEIQESKKYHNVRFVLEEFMRMDATIVEIDPIREGYKNVSSARSSFIVSIKRHGYKNTIVTRAYKDKLYLIKTMGGNKNVL